MRFPLLGLPVVLLLACDDASVTVDDTGKGGNDTNDTNDTSDTGSVTDGSISVSPTRIDLPVIFVGKSASAPIVVTNVGEGPVSVTVSVLGGHAADWTLDAYTSAPAPGQSATHTASLTPTAWGDFSVSLIVEDAESDARIEVPVVAHVQEDTDNDGYGSVATGGEDCEDDDATINPGVEEAWYDGLDSNCDGANDYDQDGDGVMLGSDCDDEDASTYPGAADAWYDGVDSDCAGNDDYDQDLDGYGTDDCDDADPTVNPAATDTWYDAVDTNCDGANDFDQDGDGYQVDVDCDDTDASANPGATEIWYDGIDQACDGGDDYDQDGDGVDYPTDCSDTDPTTTGPTAEVVDGIDSDCDGYIDDFTATELASGILYGTTASMGLGDHGAIALTSDITGDGANDLVLTAAGYSAGYAWVVEGADAVIATSYVTDSDTATISGSSGYYPLRYVNGPFGDADADGDGDLVVGGKYASAYYGESYGFEGGTGLTGAISASSSDATFTGDSSSYADDAGQVANGDLDGDGQAETVLGSDFDNGSDSLRDSGSLAIFTGFSDTYDLGDSDDLIYGAAAYDYLGISLTLADVDGDGYLDMLAGAPGYDEGADDAGGLFVIQGNSALSWDSAADDAALFEIQGDTSDRGLGEDTLAHPGDIDGDGNLDVGLTSEDGGAVWLFVDAGSLSGAVSLSAADYELTGTAGDFGSSLAMDSDLDADGDDDIVIGADGDDTAGTNAGAAFVFSWASTWGSSLTSTNASVTLWGTAADEYFGTGAAGGFDLDGDGTEDVVIGAASNDTKASAAGAAYIIQGW